MRRIRAWQPAMGEGERLRDEFAALSCEQAGSVAHPSALCDGAGIGGYNTGFGAAQRRYNTRFRKFDPESFP